MSTSSFLLALFGWGIGAFIGVRDRDGLFLHPRLAALVNFAAGAICARGAYVRGAGTWGGLMLAAFAIVAARWALMASVDSWAAWSVGRDVKAAKARAAAAPQSGGPK